MNSVPSSFWEWMALLDSGERTGLLVLSIVALTFTVSIVLFTVSKIHKTRLDDALKRELLDRGLSADDIATVISARPCRGFATHSKMGDV